MNIEELKVLNEPEQLQSPLVKAMWYDLHRHWDTAHRIVQDLSGTQACWIHAYLHRKEGDIGNSKYWYRAAGRDYPGNMDFEEEAQHILNEI